MIKKALINRNDHQFYHSSVQAALSLGWHVKSTNGSRCCAVAGQCDVKMNQDWSFTEAAELSRATAAKAGSLICSTEKKKTPPHNQDATSPCTKGLFKCLTVHQYLRQRSFQFKTTSAHNTALRGLINQCRSTVFNTAIFKEEIYI